MLSSDPCCEWLGRNGRRTKVVAWPNSSFLMQLLGRNLLGVKSLVILYWVRDNQMARNKPVPVPAVSLPRPTLEKKAANKTAFKKGDGKVRNPAGRPKGSQNKVTISVKAALQEAFTDLGGVPALVRWARMNTTDFYKLWTRLLPLQITGNDGGPIQIVKTKHDLSKLSVEELTTLAKLVDKTSMAQAEAGEQVEGGVSIRLKMPKHEDADEDCDATTSN